MPKVPSLDYASPSRKPSNSPIQFERDRNLVVLPTLKMAPTISQHEIEHLTYLSKRGDLVALIDKVKEIAVRENRSVLTIFACARNEADRNKGLSHYIAEYGN